MKMMPTLRAALLCLALGAAAIAAVPAQAAGPHLSFGFGFGLNDDDRMFPTICLERSDYQLRRDVAAKGYSNIYLNSPIHRRIEVRATKGEWVYLLEVSICTGRILESRKLRHT
jgi:hypothetical protein